MIAFVNAQFLGFWDPNTEVNLKCLEETLWLSSFKAVTCFGPANKPIH